MIDRVHARAGRIALSTILLFWISTVTVELLGGPEAIAIVKRMILLGLVVLIPAMIATALTGIRLAALRRDSDNPDMVAVIAAKRRRMPLIAANGLLVLVPAAIWLDHLAQSGAFDGLFFVVQAVELIAGAINIALMAANIRDGRRLIAQAVAA